ncbi:hypothetical protein E4U36_001867 [Claviceps purpurea]|nr:hypothetical protein E4U36_001867 [Claviceps purpurea]
MPDAASPLNQTTRHSVTEKDPDITMPDASPFVRRVTHRSVADEDPDITMPDAPKLRKPITRPTVHAFASASKDYLDYDDFTRAQCIFLQQNKPKCTMPRSPSRAYNQNQTLSDHNGHNRNTQRTLRLPKRLRVSVSFGSVPSHCQGALA